MPIHSTENALQHFRSNHSDRRPPEWQALLQCAAPHPDRGHLANLLRRVHWPLFLVLAEDHGLVPLLAEQMQHFDSSLVSEDVRRGLRETRRAHTVFTLQLTSELFRLLQRFAEAGLEILVTKGPALSVRCYRDPGLRQYGDLDLIVRDRDILRATQVMLDLAYEPRVPLTAIHARKMPGEYAFRKPGTHLLVEFHTERTFRYHPRPLPIENLFQRRASILIDGREVPVLSLEDELVLICVHGAKHFWERLMWIADVAALISSSHGPDWHRVMQLAHEVGAGKILHLGLRLASDLFGARLPAQLDAAVRSNRAVSRLAAQVTKRLESGAPHDIGILQRAAFRMRMREGLLPGAAYFLRLLLSPTEEDWLPGKEANRPAFLDSISRPFRLAKKHSRSSKD
jgi:Uncharacterised nucleotidyltransferase